MVEKKFSPKIRWPFRLELNRDTNYYFGLTLLCIASLSILWAVLRDAFDPKDFLIYFLVYMWGYVMLLKSDFDLRVTRLESSLKQANEKIDVLEKSLYSEEVSEEDAVESAEEDFIPGLSGLEDSANPGKQDIYNEWTTE